eukprot:12422834-Karenia_brevis.AAC.1
MFLTLVLVGGHPLARKKVGNDGPCWPARENVDVLPLSESGVRVGWGAGAGAGTSDGGGPQVIMDVQTLLVLVVAVVAVVLAPVGGPGPA